MASQRRSSGRSQPMAFVTRRPLLGACRFPSAPDAPERGDSSAVPSASRNVGRSDAGSFARKAARPRIAYVTSRFPKISETFILNEILELERLGFDVEVFALIRERPDVMHPHAARLLPRVHFGAPPSMATVEAQLHWLRRRPLRYASAWWGAVRGNVRSPKFLSRAIVAVPLAAAFARDMQRLGVERVHAHYATHPALAAWVVQRLTDLPYSFTAQAHDVYVDRAMLGQKLQRASFVATVSDFNRRLLEQLYPVQARGKVVVVGNGVEPGVFQARQRPVRRRLQVLCVASLEPYKGHRYLIEACALVRAAGVDIECVLVGKGDERGAIERRVADLDLGDTVRLLGAQPQERVSELMATADMMVLPSVVMPDGKMEGLPVVILEAMAVRTPVIASAISGIPELVEDNVTGLLVPERDAAALARAVVRLARDPRLRQELAENAWERVTKDYDLRATTGRLAALLTREPLPA
jgi:colanic acid/amylovoran biosynthesis glycosyltransferase